MIFDLPLTTYHSPLTPLLQSWDRQSRWNAEAGGHALRFLARLFAHFLDGLVNRCPDQVFQHFAILQGPGRLRNCNRLHLHLAVDADLHHVAASRAFGLDFAQFGLKLFGFLFDLRQRAHQAGKLPQFLKHVYSSGVSSSGTGTGSGCSGAPVPKPESICNGRAPNTSCARLSNGTCCMTSCARCRTGAAGGRCALPLPLLPGTGADFGSKRTFHACPVRWRRALSIRSMFSGWEQCSYAVLYSKGKDRTSAFGAEIAGDPAFCR